MSRNANERKCVQARVLETADSAAAAAAAATTANAYGRAVMAIAGTDEAGTDEAGTHSEACTAGAGTGGTGALDA